MNYQDPKLQKLLLKQAATQPWGGVANKTPWYDKYLREAEQMNVALKEVGLRSQLQNAQIEQMHFNRDLDYKQLGLQRGWLDWRKNYFDKKLDDEERNLNISTVLGLGTAGLAAYEGLRRKKKTEELTTLLKSIGGKS